MGLEVELGLADWFWGFHWPEMPWLAPSGLMCRLAASFCEKELDAQADTHSCFSVSLSPTPGFLTG